MAVLSLGAALVAGCGASPSTDSGITVVATTSIWGDVVGEIVGDEATVSVLIPLGADPHEYAPTSSQVATMERADLVVTNGLGLEEGLQDVIDVVVGDGGNVVDLGDHVGPLPFSGDETAPAGSVGGLDPHFWFDPDRVAIAAKLIAERLTAIDPTIDWAGRAAAYEEALSAADSKIETTLSDIPDEARKLVTSHDAFGYFALRYGFEVIGVVIPGGSTMGDPSSEHLADLVDVIAEQGVPAIFAETTEPTRLADAIAAESGQSVAVVEVYTGSLGEPGSGAETLIDLLETDARLIAGALAPPASTLPSSSWTG